MFKTLRKRIILCGGDPDYILKLAEYVDSTMRAVADETHTANSEQLAVLTAVRIANELLKTKLEGEEKKTSGKEETTEQADSFDALVGEGDQPRKPFTEEDGTCQEDCVWQGAVLSYEFNNSELGVCETGKSIEPRWPVGAVELRANAADRRKGGAMGQASWRSSFLGQRSAKFLPETRVR